MKTRSIILISDRRESRTFIAQELTREGFVVQATDDPFDLCSVFKRADAELAIVDLELAGISGLDVLRLAKRIVPDLPVIIITGQANLKSAIISLREGAEDYLVEPFAASELVAAVNRCAAMRYHRSQMVRLSDVVEMLAGMHRRRDPFTAEHQRRVAELSWAIALEMGLTKQQMEGVRAAALVHDIGKLYIPPEILAKPYNLTPLERGLVHLHPRMGAELLAPVKFPWPVADIILQHHERMDGSGYPQGLTGNLILMEARVIAVADVAEAMLTHRPYRPAKPVDKAMDELLELAGTRLDCNGVEACRSLFLGNRFEFYCVQETRHLEQQSLDRMLF
jgi:putative two-component system response regulator